MLVSCVTYNKMWVGPTSVFDDQETRDKIDGREVFVHDPVGNQYSVQAPEMTDSTLIGNFVLIETVSVPEKLKGPEQIQKRKEMHFYTTDSLPPEKVGSTVSRSEIKEIAVYDYDKGETLSKRIIIAVVVGLMLGGLIIYWLVKTIIDAFNDTVNTGACYIATMAYGSYDAPEVITLRNFRDQVLKKYFFGRLFIGTYYLISPTFVKLTKNLPGVNRLIKNRLDKLVAKLRSSGIK